MLFTAMLVGGAVGAGLGLLGQGIENQRARERADRDAALAKKQAAFNRKQGRQLYGSDGLYRRQANDSLEHARTDYSQAKEQVSFSWDQAQAGYDLNVSSLDYNKGRAEEQIGRQNIANKAALGAYGVRGGSGRERAGEVIQEATEDLEQSYTTSKTQMDMQLSAAEKQKDWAYDELDQSMEKAEQSHGYAVEQADMGLEAANKGYEFASEGIENQLSDIYADTGAMSMITAGISGAVSGAQAGASLYSFGQQYGSQLKSEWNTIKSNMFQSSSQPQQGWSAMSGNWGRPVNSQDPFNSFRDLSMGGW